MCCNFVKYFPFIIEDPVPMVEFFSVCLISPVPTQ